MARFYVNEVKIENLIAANVLLHQEPDGSNVIGSVVIEPTASLLKDTDVVIGVYDERDGNGKDVETRDEMTGAAFKRYFDAAIQRRKCVCLNKLCLLLN